MSTLNFFVHPQGLCETLQVGKNTRIWAFTHILPGAIIGQDCNICDHVFIENKVVLGDRVTVKSGVQLWDGLKIDDDVFIGPNATFTNDLFPRSKGYKTPLTTHLCRGASIGANATILPGLSIGANAMVGAGSVVTCSVPARAIVMGNPAVITGYTDTPRFDIQEQAPSSIPNVGSRAIGVGDSTMHHFPTIIDSIRGNLTPGIFNFDIPFTPLRYFIVHDVPSKEVRGEHAHKSCKQFLICIHGSVVVLLDDGEKRIEVSLDNHSMGIYVPPMIWCTQYRYSKDAKLLVYASEPYESEDYIRDYETFLNLKQVR